MDPIKKLIDAAKAVVATGIDGSFNAKENLKNAIRNYESSPPPACKWGLEEITEEEAIVQGLEVYASQCYSPCRVFHIFRCDDKWILNGWGEIPPIPACVTFDKFYRLIPLSDARKIEAERLKKAEESKLITIGNGAKVKLGDRTFYAAWNIDKPYIIDGPLNVFGVREWYFLTQEEADEFMHSKGLIEIADGWVDPKSDTIVYHVIADLSLDPLGDRANSWIYSDHAKYYFLSLPKAEAFLKSERVRIRQENERLQAEIKAAQAKAEAENRRAKEAADKAAAAAAAAKAVAARAEIVRIRIAKNEKLTESYRKELQKLEAELKGSAK